MSPHRNALALIAATGLLAFIAACGSGQSSEDKSQGGMPQQDQAALAEVKTAFLNLGNLKSFRAQMSAQVPRPDGTVGATDFLYEVVLPDRFQLAVVGSQTATRVVGGETFARAASGTWTVIAEWSGSEYGGLNKLFSQQTIAALTEELGKTATVTKGAMDSSEGKQCQVYTVTNLGTKNTTDVCVADRLPLRIIYNTGPLKTTVLLRDFNATIDLGRPPV